MHHRIKAIRNSTTIEIDPPWQKGVFTGRALRIAGTRAARAENGQEIIHDPKSKLLLGRSCSIIETYYVESGPTLVATINVADVDLSKVFSGRYDIPLPKLRFMEGDDQRVIRKINGGRSSAWKNPLRGLPIHLNPCLGDVPFVIDETEKNFDDQTKRALAVFSEEREDLEEDNLALARFLEFRSERVLLLFGHAGTGKSWFVRHYLMKHRPEKMDVAFVDLVDYPINDITRFRERLELDIEGILDRFVNQRPGGLHEALRFHLEPKAKGLFPNNDYDDPPVRAWVQGFLEKLSAPENRSVLNTLRLRFYASTTHDLLLVIDNLDGFSQDEQVILLENVILSMLAGQRVFVIVTVRPSSKFFSERLGAFLQTLRRDHTLSPLRLRAMIRRRFLLSESLENIELAPVQGRGIPITLRRLFDDFYANSEAEHLITDLSQGDARHYIRLFRRHVFSNEIRPLDNIGNEYHCVRSLMVLDREPYDSNTTFILNVFDNDHREETGNALIRWRVLEYFHLGYEGCGEKDKFFKYYFERLGYNMLRVKEVKEKFREAGILEISRAGDSVYSVITQCGRRYLSLTENLWYCIAIKTGMNIDAALILSGEAAEVEADKYGVSVPEGREWVPDTHLLAFIATEEEAEQVRLSRNEYRIEEFEKQIEVKGPEPIARRLTEIYLHQQHMWERKRQGASSSATQRQ